MTTAGNRIEIQVGAKTQEAEAGFKRVQSKGKELTKDVGGLQAGLGGLGKAMGGIGLAAIGSVFSLNKLADAASVVSQRSASTSLILDAFGGGLRKRLVELQPQFAGIGRAFGYTESAVVGAFGAIVRASQGSEIDIKKLQFAMGLARASSLDLSGAADVVGKAMLGNVGPLEAVIGRVNSLEEAQKTTIARGEEATTSMQQLGTIFSGIFEGIAGEWEQFIGTFTFGIVRMVEDMAEKLKQDWANVKATLGEPLKITIDAIGTFFDDILPGWWKSTVGWLGRTWNITINALGDFFGDRIPGWWSSVVGWLGKAAKVTINATGDFFGDLMPDWMKTVMDKLWPATNWFYLGAFGTFFDDILPSWWTAVKDFIGKSVGFTLDIGGRFVGTLTKFLWKLWGFVELGTKWTIGVVLDIGGRFVGALTKFLGKLWSFVELGTEWTIGLVLDIGGAFVGTLAGWLSALWGWIRDKSGPSIAVGFATGILSGLVGFFFDQWGNVRAAPVVRVLVDFVAQAGKDIWQLIKKGLDPRQLIFDIGTTGNLFGLAGASGGNFGAGGMTLVGERGPELVNLPSGSSIRPSLAGMGSLGGGITINVYGNIDNEITIQSMVRQMKEALEDAERVGPSFG